MEERKFERPVKPKKTRLWIDVTKPTRDDTYYVVERRTGHIIGEIPRKTYDKNVEKILIGTKKVMGEEVTPFTYMRRKRRKSMGVRREVTHIKRLGGSEYRDILDKYRGHLKFIVRIKLKSPNGMPEWHTLLGKPYDWMSVEDLLYDAAMMYGTTIEDIEVDFVDRHTGNVIAIFDPKNMIFYKRGMEEYLKEIRRRRTKRRRMKAKRCRC